MQFLGLELVFGSKETSTDSHKYFVMIPHMSYRMFLTKINKQAECFADD